MNIINGMSLESIKKRFGISGHALVLNRAIAMAAQVAPTPLSILIRGENGSGKESFARLIHYLSHIKHGEFVAVNCGAIPEGTMDSELFGHEKGSFTGAATARKGYFEVANQGTIFLDEIGEMPLPNQPRLLRVLENKEFMRVGSSKKQKSDARIIAATNAKLEEYVQQGRFREDLYYRLAQITITVPPLRERGEDIILLFKKFTLDFASEYQTKLVQLDQEASDMILHYPFPGNIRQLKNIAWQVAALENNQPLITGDIIAKYLPKVGALPATTSQYSHALHDQERKFLYRIVRKLQHEIEHMKKAMYDLSQSEQQKPKRVTPSPSHLLGPSSSNKIDSEAVSIAQQTNLASDEPAEQEEETLSLAHQEKKLIEKAIAKYKHRKEAAYQLGIAERTLYRKIKEYEL
ncbi:MAG: sigma-54 dependent transcriptional regulator [Bacteroidota bacterium]